MTMEAPINHTSVDIGEAKNPRGRATQSNPVYSWDVLNEPKGVCKSAPFNLLIPITPKKTNRITNNNAVFVNRVYKVKEAMIKE